jgi:DNA-binding MarR family transcriptional regulator
VLAVTKQALNAPLRQLIEMGLVVQGTGHADRRVRALALTPAGLALEADLTGVQMTQLQAAFVEAGQGAEPGWRQVMARLAKQPFES